MDGTVTYKSPFLSMVLNLDSWLTIWLRSDGERPNNERQMLQDVKTGRLYQCFMSSFTSLSWNCWPMGRLKAKTVLAELTTA